MKPQEKKESYNFSTWLIVLVMVVIASLAKYILWPILRVTGQAIAKVAKAAWNRTKAPSKKEKPSVVLKTPDIFKDAPNLAPAKEFRFR